MTDSETEAPLRTHKTYGLFDPNVFLRTSLRHHNDNMIGPVSEVTTALTPTTGTDGGQGARTVISLSCICQSVVELVNWTQTLHLTCQPPSALPC